MDDIRRISKILLVGFFAWGTLTPVRAALSSEVPKLNEGSSLTNSWLLNFLLPKPFQKNPDLEMSMYTEMTDFGRTLPTGSAQAPVYFVAQDGGEKSLGEQIFGENPPPREALNDMMLRSLAAAGYLPAGDKHRAGLVLTYFWGSHNKMDPELARHFPELARQHFLERTMLVSGRTYAKTFALYGSMGIDLKTESLIRQADESIYYVVVSAYDYGELARNRRRLAWRTTMTVSAGGVSMRQCMPALIATGRSYFGREMTEAQVILRNVREGTVILAPLKIIEGNVP